MLALDLEGAAGRAAASGVTVSTDAQLLRVLLRHTTPTVRPDDVITALAATGEGLPQVTPLMPRLVQGPWSEADATVGDPLR